MKAFNQRAERLRIASRTQPHRAADRGHDGRPTELSAAEAPLHRALRMWRKYKALHLHNAADRNDDTADDDAPATSESAGDRGSFANSSHDRRDDSAARRALTDHENLETENVTTSQSCDQQKAQPSNLHSTDANGYLASTDGNRYQKRRAEDADFTAWLEENDPFLAWLTINRVGLSARSPRGPRPSQCRTLPSLSPLSTWDLDSNGSTSPKVTPKPGDDFDIARDVIVDGGAGIFSSPRRELFLAHTLRPTDVVLCGIDNEAKPADLEGIAQCCFLDAKQRIVWRITTPGVLTEDAIPGGYTLLSLSQLRANDGIGNNTPSNRDELPFLYTGNVHEPSRCAYIREVSDGLISITPLSPRRVQKLIAEGLMHSSCTSSS